MPPLDPVPLSRLPHGEAARLLTRAAADPGAGIVLGYREALPPDAHANTSGFFPACLLIELMAQAAGLGLPQCEGAVVASIPRMRLHRAARALEPVEVEARLGRRLGVLFRFECRAVASGDLLADGEIVLRMA